jgi:cytochrome d ubiquinol oxidase subunit II
VLLALVSVLYISAMFLTYYAAKAKDFTALAILRKYAIAWSMPTIFASLLVFFAIHNHNPEHYQKMLDYSWMFVLSLLAFFAALYLVWRERSYGWAFILVMVQFALAFFGYGVSHLPSILYPYIHLYDNFTNRTMALYLIGAFLAGLLLLIPSLYLLMRLFLFNTPYVEGIKPKKG